MLARETSLFILLIIASFFLIYPASALYEKYNGLMVGWHKAKICMPCHVNTLNEGKLRRFLQCTPCHSKNLKDPEVIKKLHGVNVCIKCHVGSEFSASNLGLKVHVPHKQVDCSTCHGKEEPSKPDARVCSDCHDTDPHEVHGEKLGEMCIFCHSSRIYDYIKEKPESIPKEVKITPTPAETPKKERKFPTSISDIIMGILNFIFNR